MQRAEGQTNSWLGIHNIALSMGSRSNKLESIVDASAGQTGQHG